MSISQREHQWVEVDLSAIQNNLKAFQESTNRPVLTIIKANAYGHGLVPVAKAVIDAGAAYLGVTSVGEAIPIRAAGVQGHILVLGPQFGAEYEKVAELDLECVVWTKEQVEDISAIAQRLGKKISVHVKIDIGMSRFGILPQEVPDFLRFVSSVPGIEVKGLHSHLSASDENADITNLQQEKFLELVKSITDQGLRPPVVQISNSGASSAYPDLWFDLVRIGIVLYGYPALSDAPVSKKLIPALSWKARLVSIRKLPANSLISYGGEYKTTKEESVGVISVGYTDGFKRIPKNCNEVLIRGKRAKVLGRMCQQFCMVSLDHISEAKLFDEVVLIGRSENESIWASEIAKRWGTNEWDVLCGINGLVERKYI